MRGRIDFHPAIPLYERPGMALVLTPLVIAEYDVFVHPSDVETDHDWHIRVSRADSAGFLRIREEATKAEWESAVATYLRDRP